MDENVCYMLKTYLKNIEHYNFVGDDINLKLIIETRLETIKKKGEKRKDELHTRPETILSSFILKTHENCINKYMPSNHK